MIARLFLLIFIVSVAVLPSTPAHAQEHDADWYKTHWTASWNGWGYANFFYDDNLGNTSTLAKGKQVGDGAMELYFLYSKNWITPDYALGAFHLGASATGRLYFSFGGPSLFRPALEASWNGPPAKVLGGIGPGIELTYGYQDYGLHLRDAWNPTLLVWISRSWSSEWTTNSKGFADSTRLSLRAGYDFEMESAVSKRQTEKDVFNGQQQDAYLGASFHPVAKLAGSPLGWFDSVDIMGKYRVGDLVSTGPATADVVAAAKAATPDRLIDGSTALGYDAYRMSARTESIAATIWFTTNVYLRGTREMISADARTSGSPAFHAVRNRVELRFSRSW